MADPDVLDRPAVRRPEVWSAVLGATGLLLPVLLSIMLMQSFDVSGDFVESAWSQSFLQFAGAASWVITKLATVAAAVTGVVALTSGRAEARSWAIVGVALAAVGLAGSSDSLFPVSGLGL